MKEFCKGDIVEFVGPNGKESGSILVAEVIHPTHASQHFVGKVLISNMGSYYQKGVTRSMSYLVFQLVEDSEVYEENILKLFQATVKLDRVLRKNYLSHEI